MIAHSGTSRTPNSRRYAARVIMGLLLAGSQAGCVGTLVGTAADIAVEAAKVPFKFGGAAVDALTDGDEGEARPSDRRN